MSSVTSFGCFRAIPIGGTSRTHGNIIKVGGRGGLSRGGRNWTGASVVEIHELQNWLKDSKDLELPSKLQVQQGLQGEGSAEVGFVAASTLEKGEVGGEDGSHEGVIRSCGDFSVRYCLV